MKESTERVLEWTVIITFAALILLVLPVFWLGGSFVALIYLAVVLPCIGIALGVHYYVWKRYHYICLSCSAIFKPPFIKSLTGINAGNKRGLRCPKCGCHGMMNVYKDTEHTEQMLYRR